MRLEPETQARPHPYAGGQAALATMHRKERAIAPTLAEQVGLQVIVPRGLNTDRLGTFTGETPRAGTIEEAAIAKARLGMDAAGLPLGLANEGAYGPHPQIPFIAAGVELIVLVDDARGLIVKEHIIEEAPHYDHAVVGAGDDLDAFLVRVEFPETGLIVRPNGRDPIDAPVRKGIREQNALMAAIRDAAREAVDGKAFVQTDMRAHVNPRRMATLTRLAERFAARLARLCPDCGAPGYGMVDVESGLPCAGCGAPSGLVRFEVFGCAACDRHERRPRADGLEAADPRHCHLCNP
ncbi:DUF6671 family protein [Dichotomicrobium thermohalophilum]|uniref:DUF6671 domain-containing protein n=1 Tax=Dichotomicrobium thermohalophilum TaxID=933063 RepID=A0A397QDH0_9HYPH|nr:DUF6671 family protein [Dichotomicrobium thermohalophilum]RIA56134.1 hypothetical protein BXY53_1234 [Dichotomicrobium thermohalophilum]